MTRVWLVGQVRGNGAWEVQGVFSAEERAIAVCESPSFFVMPLEMDKAVPSETSENAGAYYPLMRDSAL